MAIGACRARRRRRRHDRGLGRRGDIDRAAARSAVSHQRRGSEAGSPTWPAVGRSRSAVGAALVYGTLGLPAFSDPQAPIHTHVVPRYLSESLKETGVPNVVTSVLASYRGYDTLGRDDGRVHRRRRRHRTACAVASAAVTRSSDERRPGPAGHREAAHSVHAALCALRAVPRRARAGRRLSGRRDHRRGDRVLRADLRTSRRAAARCPMRSWSRMVAGGVLDLRRSRGRRAAARRKLPRLLRARSRPGARAGARHLLGRGRRGDHRLRRDAQDLLHVRRARRAIRKIDESCQSLRVLDHDVPDDRGAVHRHRPRQPGEEADRPRHLPDVGLPAVHRAGQADRGDRADPRRSVHDLLQSAATRADPHCDRGRGSDARAWSRDRGAHPRSLRHYRGRRDPRRRTSQNKQQADR